MSVDETLQFCTQFLGIYYQKWLPIIFCSCYEQKLFYLVHFHIRNEDDFDDDDDTMGNGVCQIMMLVDGGGGGLERPKIRGRHL